jgi:hypothetical protein
MYYNSSKVGLTSIEDKIHIYGPHGKEKECIYVNTFNTYPKSRKLALHPIHTLFLLFWCILEGRKRYSKA